MSKPKVVRESVSLYDAKTHLSALVERAAAGEEIVITKSGRPRALLVPFTDAKPERTFGHGKGQWHIVGDINDPLPDDLLDEFYKPL